MQNYNFEKQSGQVQRFIKRFSVINCELGFIRVCKLPTVYDIDFFICFQNQVRCAVFAYSVSVGFADTVIVAEDSIQEHSCLQIVSCRLACLVIARVLVPYFLFAWRVTNVPL